jgi:Transcription factor IIA, alpha/beta subunit
LLVRNNTHNVTKMLPRQNTPFFFLNVCPPRRCSLSALPFSNNFSSHIFSVIYFSGHFPKRHAQKQKQKQSKSNKQGKAKKCLRIVLENRKKKESRKHNFSTMDQRLKLTGSVRSPENDVKRLYGAVFRDVCKALEQQLLSRGVDDLTTNAAVRSLQSRWLQKLSDKGQAHIFESNGAPTSGTKRKREAAAPGMVSMPAVAAAVPGTAQLVPVMDPDRKRLRRDVPLPPTAPRIAVPSPPISAPVAVPVVSHMQTPAQAQAYAQAVANVQAQAQIQAQVQAQAQAQVQTSAQAPAQIPAQAPAQIQVQTPAQIPTPAPTHAPPQAVANLPTPMQQTSGTTHPPPPITQLQAQPQLQPQPQTQQEAVSPTRPLGWIPQNDGADDGADGKSAAPKKSIFDDSSSDDDDDDSNDASNITPAEPSTTTEKLSSSAAASSSSSSSSATASTATTSSSLSTDAASTSTTSVAISAPMLPVQQAKPQPAPPQVARRAASPPKPQLDSDNESLGDVSLSEDEQWDTDNIVVCNYDLVKRTKNKYTCKLVNGIIVVHGTDGRPVDFVFQKAKGEFVWK